MGAALNATLEELDPDEFHPGRGTLTGLCFGVKDVFQIKNHPLTFGLNPPLIEKAPSHAALVQRLLELGAIPSCRTNMDEAALSSDGSNRHYGKVVNPRSPELSPTGSSSGSAAAVAAGLVDFAIGTDFGGSVRAPAAACGICGLRFSPSLIPTAGTVQIDPVLDSPGIFTPGLPEMQKIVSTLLAAAPGKSPQRILVLEEPSLRGMNSRWLEDYKHVVSKISANILVDPIPNDNWFDLAAQIRKPIAIRSAASKLRELKLSSDRLGPTARAILEQDRRLDSNDISRELTQQTEFKNLVASVLTPGTFILTPTLPDLAPSWKELESGIDRTPERRITRFLTLANICLLPALSFFAKGTPDLALQLIGPESCEAEIVEAALGIERWLR